MQETPEWLAAYHTNNPQDGTQRPNGSRGWAPGQSGNPNGRPKGSKNKKSVIAEEFEKEGSEVARVVIDAAKGGDLQACNIVLARLSPPLKSRAEKVQFQFTPDAPLTQQAQQVLAAVAAGDIDPDTGKLLIDAVSAFAGLKQVDEFGERLTALEQGRGR